ncbi:hypothetical protein G9F72_005300 [Clostridium estertheticum]|uniref:hypothetical protein n=1 Tax=Clostridium estertheticum TaxID=238834 RepID=UPI0013E9455C|nr:hypothetical protein [Clostridium estertheticum]MBZ9685761.1 hypothetical protein [Clostridium estertheticum]
MKKGIREINTIEFIKVDLEDYRGLKYDFSDEDVQCEILENNFIKNSFFMKMASLLSGDNVNIIPIKTDDSWI